MTTRSPSRRDVLSALAGFTVTVVAAVASGWQAADLVWGLWISSLITGYWLMLLATFGSLAEGRGFLYRYHWVKLEEGDASLRVLVSAVLLLFFFSTHFLLFHHIHQLITQRFFPLPGGEGGRLPFVLVVAESLRAYWPVVLVSLWVQHKPFQRALRDVPAVVIELPYHAVIRNHLMIFLVAGVNALGAGAWLLYALLVFYFFPFDILRRPVTRVGTGQRE